MKTLLRLCLWGCLLALAPILPLAAATIYNGDKIAGVAVISQLDLSTLAAGKAYRFMFKGAGMNIGQSWYVPVLVVKGKYPGARLLLDTGIHGDELNGSRVVQQIMAGINPLTLHGSVIGVIQANPNGLAQIKREWQLSSGYLVDLNRQFPGDLNGNAAQIQAYKLWHDLWAGNVDYVVDLHTDTSDSHLPLFVFADYRVPAARHMAELIPADQIKADPGEPGSVETTFIEQHIPAITLEIGQGRTYQPEYIQRAIVGIQNIMRDLKMLPGALGPTALNSATYFGNDQIDVFAQVGGYNEILVQVGDILKSGDLIARQRNPFGDVIVEYRAPLSGKVLSTTLSATSDPGASLVGILFQNPDPKCALGC